MMKLDGFVLVHGYNIGSWCWDELLPELGLPTLAVDLPGRQATKEERRQLTWQGAVQSVIDDISGWEKERVILVGHSAAGFIIPAVAAAIPDKIAALVFIAAVIPPEGKGAIDTMPWPMRWIIRILAKRGLSFKPPKFLLRWALQHELTQEQARKMMGRTTIEAPGTLPEAMHYGDLPAETPRYYIVCNKDRAIKPKQQRLYAGTIGAQTIEIDAGHSVMISRPQELGQILNSINSDMT